MSPQSSVGAVTPRSWLKAIPAGQIYNMSLGTEFTRKALRHFQSHCNNGMSTVYVKQVGYSKSRVKSVCGGVLEEDRHLIELPYPLRRPSLLEGTVSPASRCFRFPLQVPHVQLAFS
eukprot:jgi/Botrbrau1/5418/Bobra.182_1s0022.1